MKRGRKSSVKSGSLPLIAKRHEPARWSHRLLNASGDWNCCLFGTLDERQTREHGTNIYRMVFEKSYLVLCTVNEDEKRVTFVSVRHGERPD